MKMTLFHKIPILIRYCYFVHYFFLYIVHADVKQWDIIFILCTLV